MEQKQTQQIKLAMEEKILEEAKTKAYPEEILMVRTHRCAIGFQKEEIADISKNTKKLAEELTGRITDLLKMAAESKGKILRESMEQNKSIYSDREGLFERELEEMKSRFDFLKKNEQRRSCLIERQMTKMTQSACKRLVINGLRQYRIQKEDLRNVIAN
jgi:hypothetical protein